MYIDSELNKKPRSKGAGILARVDLVNRLADSHRCVRASSEKFDGVSIKVSEEDDPIVSEMSIPCAGERALEWMCSIFFWQLR